MLGSLAAVALRGCTLGRSMQRNEVPTLPSVLETARGNRKRMFSFAAAPQSRVRAPNRHASTQSSIAAVALCDIVRVA